MYQIALFCMVVYAITGRNTVRALATRNVPSRIKTQQHADRVVAPPPKRSIDAAEIAIPKAGATLSTNHTLVWSNGTEQSAWPASKAQRQRIPLKRVHSTSPRLAERKLINQCPNGFYHNRLDIFTVDLQEILLEAQSITHLARPGASHSCVGSSTNRAYPRHVQQNVRVLHADR